MKSFGYFERPLMPTTCSRVVNEGRLETNIIRQNFAQSKNIKQLELIFFKLLVG